MMRLYLDLCCFNRPYDEWATGGLGRYDALHLASAMAGGADLFVTTDDRMLKKMSSSQELRVAPPLTALAILEHGYDYGN